MRKRSLLIAGLLIGLGMAGLIILYSRSETPNHINHDAFEKIDKGMTREAVVELLGVAPGNYVTKNLRFVAPVTKRLAEDALLPGHADETEEVWSGNGGKITVWFRADGKVSRRTYMPAAYPQSFVDKVRSWAGF